MREGWFGDDYVILFDRSEVEAASVRYDFANSLPGFKLVGLINWDDFIVRNSKGELGKIPTVPLDRRGLATFGLSVDDPTLQPDTRFLRKIKWHLLPTVFGGDPHASDNVIWVDHEKHAFLVRWWNAKYRGQAPAEGNA